ncbi:MAG: CPBP family intramembrane metalloprotease [Deltaproteobacteria bacterium]|nr:CPBP family intramembrane metalloprotease [Deltaproteobacteria bacterium]
MTLADDGSPTAGERSSQPQGEYRRGQLLGALGVFAIATAICSALWQLRRVLPFIQKYLHALIAFVFLYLPTTLVSRAGEHYDDYGLTHRPIKRSLIYFALISAVVFPLFVLGLFYFYWTTCRLVYAGKVSLAVYVRACRRFVGSWRYLSFRLPANFGELAAAQVIVVALPEEYFFRGYLQTKLERVWPVQRRFAGGSVGVAVIATSLLFALCHVLVDFNPLRFAVFFPSLLFGWLRQATGAILAPVLFHASCNLVSEVLHVMFF